ncbi:thiol-activated cytolysin family protein [Psychroserpens ponticola]|uniref:Thiol-activated cytolysin family protein n=1 Tax=Psychroserpens ponticola TaxID=2932268 RepID=A0ABY7S1N7_9FLAO|nr:thiol-activated cytolysin family protein [Psychroserpens ponticola]WCO03252.1 thiol-activated cytolysin family protein [Psychroserpens ponticola]
MKTIKQNSVKFNLKFCLLFALALVALNCSKPDDSTDEEEENPFAASINEYLLGLNYDGNTLLEVKNTGGLPNLRDETSSSEGNTPPVNGQTSFCSTANWSLDSNFDDVAILRPNLDAIYPGALVAANDNMLNGNPDPLSIEKGSYTLRVNLPGIGQNGVLNIQNPSKSLVDTKIDNALQWWYNNSGDNQIPANSVYSSANLYSSMQVSRDIGLNLSWADNNVASQLSFNSNTERRVATMSFKQVFFNITMDSPESSPADMLGNTITLDEVKARITDEQPAAYVSSVSYGKIFILRMETEYTEETSDIDLSAVLDYSVNVDANYDEEKNNIIQTSTFKLLSIGGNAEVGVSPISSSDFTSGPGGFIDAITGSNALLSADNPGVPIAYTMRFLKDNSLAKMGYHTDYSVEQCDPNSNFVHEDVNVVNNSYHDTRFYFKYKPAGGNFYLTGPKYELNQGSQHTTSPPNGAYDVEIIFESQIGWFGDFEQIRDIDLNHVTSEKCYRFSGGDSNDHGTVSTISCN